MCEIGSESPALIVAFVRVLKMALSCFIMEFPFTTLLYVCVQQLKLV